MEVNRFHKSATTRLGNCLLAAGGIERTASGLFSKCREGGGREGGREGGEGEGGRERERREGGTGYLDY